MYYWHMHYDPPREGVGCKIVGGGSVTTQYAQRKARKEKAHVYSSDYGPGQTCPYQELVEYTQMSAPTMIRMPDGSEVDASGMTCEECGEPMGSHGCKSSAAPAVVVSRSGKGTARKKPEDKPACPHCGAPMHFNYGATAVNATCINTQYAVGKGIITDPQHQRPPILTIDLMGEIVDWARSLATPIQYGDMVTAAGGAGTYSALRPKTGRKKKAVAAGEGEKIEDMAAKVTIDAPKTKKSRKDKTEAPVEVTQEIEPINMNGAAEEGQPIESPKPTESPEDEKARRRAERAARRQALLGKA